MSATHPVRKALKEIQQATERNLPVATIAPAKSSLPVARIAQPRFVRAPVATIVSPTPASKTGRVGQKVAHRGRSFGDRAGHPGHFRGARHREEKPGQRQGQPAGLAGQL